MERHSPPHDLEQGYDKFFSDFTDFPERPPASMGRHDANSGYDIASYNNTAAAGQPVYDKNLALEDENRILRALLRGEEREGLEGMQRDVRELKEIAQATSLILEAGSVDMLGYVDTHAQSESVRGHALSYEDLERKVYELNEELKDWQENLRVATEEFHVLVEMVDPEAMAEFRRRQARSPEDRPKEQVRRTVELEELEHEIQNLTSCADAEFQELINCLDLLGPRRRDVPSPPAERIDDRDPEEIWRDTVNAVDDAFAAKDAADDASSPTERIDNRNPEEQWRDTVTAVNDAFAAKALADALLADLREKTAPHRVAVDSDSSNSCIRPLKETWSNEAQDKHSEGTHPTEPASPPPDSPVCTCTTPSFLTNAQCDLDAQQDNYARMYDTLDSIQDAQLQIELWTESFGSQSNATSPIVAGLARLREAWLRVIDSDFWEQEERSRRGLEVGLRGGMGSPDELLTPDHDAEAEHTHPTSKSTEHAEQVEWNAFLLQTKVKAMEALDSGMSTLAMLLIHEWNIWRDEASALRELVDSTQSKQLAVCGHNTEQEQEERAERIGQQIDGLEPLESLIDVLKTLEKQGKTEDQHLSQPAQKMGSAEFQEWCAVLKEQYRLIGRDSEVTVLEGDNTQLEGDLRDSEDANRALRQRLAESEALRSKSRSKQKRNLSEMKAYLASLGELSTASQESLEVGCCCCYDTSSEEDTASMRRKSPEMSLRGGMGSPDDDVSTYAQMASLLPKPPPPVAPGLREWLIETTSLLPEIRHLLQETKDISNQEYNKKMRAERRAQDAEQLYACTNACSAGCNYHSSPLDSDQDSDSDRGRRSGAPSPESPKKPNGDSVGVWRQLQTEMAILQLQDRLAEVEKKAESKNEHLPSILVNTKASRSDWLDKGAKRVTFQARDESRCVCGNLRCTASSSAAGPRLRGGMGGRDEDEEYVYGDGEPTNWDQEDDKEMQKKAVGQQTITEHKAMDTGKADKKVNQELRQKIEELEEQVRSVSEMTRTELNEFRQVSPSGRRSTHESGEEDEVREDRECRHHFVTSFPRPDPNSPRHTRALDIYVQASPAGSSRIYMQDTHVVLFPDGVTPEQVAEVQSGRYGIKQWTDRTLTSVSAEVEHGLKNVLEHIFLGVLGAETTKTGTDSNEIKSQSVSKGKSYVFSSQSVQFLYDYEAESEGKLEGLHLRGGSGGEEHTHTGEDEDEDQDQVSVEPEVPAAEMKETSKEDAESERVFPFQANLTTILLTTDGYGRGYEMYRGKRYEHRSTKGELTDDKGIEELRAQIEKLKSELRERVCQLERLDFDDDTAPIVGIELDPNFIVPSSDARQYPSLILGKHATVFHFPNGATAEQRLALQIPRFEIGQDVDDLHIIHLGSPHMEQELKTAIIHAEQDPDQEDWDTLSKGQWPGVGTGDTYIVCDKDAIISHEHTDVYVCWKLEQPGYWIYNSMCYFDGNYHLKADSGEETVAQKIAPEKPETMSQEEWDIYMEPGACCHCHEECEECGSKLAQSIETGEEHVQMRGGNGEEKDEMDGDYEHGAKRMQHGKEAQRTATQEAKSTTTHALCRHAICQDGDNTINYLIIALPPGFELPLVHSGLAPPIILNGVATVYHFRSGATPDIVQRQAWNQRCCGLGHWSTVRAFKIPTEEFERDLKNAITNMWDTKFGWEELTRGRWPNVGQGDTYLVSDTNIGLAIIAGDQHVRQHMRGGHGEEPDPMVHQPIQRRSSEFQGLKEDFDRIYEDLLEDTAEAYSHEPTSDCTEAWITFATVLQTHNHSLEHELEEFKNMHHDLIHDLHWQIGTTVELEEQVEAAEEEKAALMEELENLKLRWERLVDFVAIEADHLHGHVKKGTVLSEDHSTFPRVWTMRGGDDVSDSTPPQECEKADDPEPGPDRLCAATTATSFDFFPKRATIVFAGDPPHIYQFSYGTTLEDIRMILDVGSGNEFESSIDEPYCARILEIMKIREGMGVRLPEDLQDERVTIGIPYVPPGTQVDSDVIISEWQDQDADVAGLNKLVQRLDINTEPDAEPKDNSHRVSASSEEEDYYHDLGDLVNTLNNTIDHNDDTGSPRICICQVCTNKGRETYFDVQNTHQTPVVSVRGGGRDHDRYHNRGPWTFDSEGNREFPLLSPKLPKETNAPPNSPGRYGTFTPGAFPAPVPLPSDHDIATSNEPLGLRLSRLMFPPKFVQEREHTIRRFSWRHTKRKNPQYKNKSSRRYKYTKGSECEDWETKLDKHREHCDYCQSVFLEEEYGTHTFEPAEDVRHEDDAPIPGSGSGRPWERSAWPDSTNTSPFPTVVDPNPRFRGDAEYQDPRLRGGAGHERDLEIDDEDDDWRSEWDDVASQAQSSIYQGRAFRNSSTLSTKTLVHAPSPVERNFRTLRRPETVDFEDIWISSGLGEYVPSRHHDRPLRSDTLSPSKTSRPWLMELRRPRGEQITGELSPRPDFGQRSTQYGLARSIKDRFSQLQAEDWLESPRPAPAPSIKRKLSDPNEEDEEKDYVRDIHTWEDEYRNHFNHFSESQSSTRQQSFRTDQCVCLPSGGHPGLGQRGLSTRTRTLREDWGTQERLANSTHEHIRRLSPMKGKRVPTPKPFINICQQCAELLALQIACLKKLKDRLSPRMRKSVPESSEETAACPAPTKLNTYAENGCDRPSVLVSRLDTLKERVRAMKTRSPSKSPKETPSCPAPTISNTVFRDCYHQEPIHVQRLDKSPKQPRAPTALHTKTTTNPACVYDSSPVPVSRLNKSLPPTPQASTSTVNLPLSSNNLKLNLFSFSTTKTPHSKSAALPPFSLALPSPVSQITLFERACAMAEAHDAMQAELVWQGTRNGNPPTVAGPSDLVRRAALVLEWEERRERGEMMG